MYANKLYEGRVSLKLGNLIISVYFLSDFLLVHNNSVQLC